MNLACPDILPTYIEFGIQNHCGKKSAPICVICGLFSRFRAPSLLSWFKISPRHLCDLCVNTVVSLW